VLFDGHCGLCDRSVQLLLRWDRTGVLHFAPLQGPTAAPFAPPSSPHDPGTFVLVDQQGTHLRSEAALRTLAHLGPLWRAVLIFRVVPRPLRDAVYNWVARHRYRWFGQLDACRIPSVEVKARFLP
jgi:predicted DCC family thiol-disulfide oxidoreductase YuxK